MRTKFFIFMAILFCPTLASAEVVGGTLSTVNDQYVIALDVNKPSKTSLSGKSIQVKLDDLLFYRGVLGRNQLKSGDYLLVDLKKEKNGVWQAESFLRPEGEQWSQEKLSLLNDEAFKEEVKKYEEEKARIRKSSDEFLSQTPINRSPVVARYADQRSDLVIPRNTAANQSQDNDMSTSKNITPIDQDNDEKSLRIVAEIRQRLLTNEALSIKAKNIKVVVTEGQVYLLGNVDSFEDYQMIHRTAVLFSEDFPVINQIKTKA